MGRTSRGVVGFLGVAMVISIVLGWVGGPLLSLAQHLPVFSNNNVSRIRSLLGFLVAALAGFGFERLLNGVCGRENDPQRLRCSDKSDDTAASYRPGPGSRHLRLEFGRIRISWPVVVLAVVTCFALLVLKDAISDATARHAIRPLAHQVAAPAVLLVICVSLVVAARRGPRWTRYAAIVAIPLIAVGQSATAFRASIPGSDPANFYPVTSTHRFLQKNLGLDQG